MPDLPPEAVEAAVHAMARYGHREWETVAFCDGALRGPLVVALEAAAPHIAAAVIAEHERLTAAEAFQILLAVINKIAQQVSFPLDAAADLLAAIAAYAGRRASDAATTQREHDAQLAEALKFRLYRPGNGPGAGTHALDAVPLGELLALLRQPQAAP